MEVSSPRPDRVTRFVPGHDAKLHALTPEERRRRRNLRQQKFDQRRRLEALVRLGGACTCCGLEDVRFLTFDHTESDGAAHRLEMGAGGGKAIVNWLFRIGFEQDKVQVLCFNCNFGKACNGGVCPHVRTED